MVIPKVKSIKTSLIKYFLYVLFIIPIILQKRGTIFKCFGIKGDSEKSKEQQKKEACAGYRKHLQILKKYEKIIEKEDLLRRIERQELRITRSSEKINIYNAFIIFLFL